MSINYEYGLNKVRLSIRAFTLLEVMIVLAILVVTTSVMIPNVMDQRKNAKIQAANDGAYTVYVATQDYLNHLQKRGLDAKKYFGKSGELTSAFLTTPEKDIGFLSVNGGVLQPVDDTNGKKSAAYKTGDFTGNMVSPPEEEYLREAFIGICKRMGKAVLKEGDSDYNKYKTVLNKAKVYGEPISPEMNAAGESFLIEVYPDTYTVRCVYYTTYNTERIERTTFKSSSSKRMDSAGKKIVTGYGTDDIFNRIYGDHTYDLKSDTGTKPQPFLGVSGFASRVRNSDNTFSQEYVSKISGMTPNETYSYAPAFVGQYPLPAY